MRYMACRYEFRTDLCSFLEMIFMAVIIFNLPVSPLLCCNVTYYNLHFWFMLHSLTTHTPQAHTLHTQHTHQRLIAHSAHNRLTHTYWLTDSLLADSLQTHTLTHTDRTLRHFFTVTITPYPIPHTLRGIDSYYFLHIYTQILSLSLSLTIGNELWPTGGATSPICPRSQNRVHAYALTFTLILILILSLSLARARTKSIGTIPKYN